MMTKIKQLDKFVWELEKEGEMRVPARLYVDSEMINVLKEEEKTNWSTLRQLKNVAAFPGLQKHVLALADCHPGYGSPIGGVFASDLNEGVITFGGVGFDINCLPGDAKVMHSLGYHRRIKDFENDWIEEKIKCLNPHKKVLDTSIDAFLKFRPKNELYELTTEAGHKLVATADHPILTQKGMVEVSKMNGQQISVFPFEGVEFEQPKGKTIFSEKNIKKIANSKTSYLQNVKNLKRINLLPLKTDNKKLPYLIRILGFALGDGTLRLTKGKSQLKIYSDKGDLEKIKEDIEALGFKCGIYSRKRKHKIKTKYGIVKFKRTEHSLSTSSKGLCIILNAIGLPSGDKTKQEFYVSSWLKKAPKWQKRLFLAGFFGAELNSPATTAGHKYNLDPAVISLNKKETYNESGRKFLKQISEMLKEFGVNSKLIAERDEYENEKGEKSVRLRLVISNKPENLIKLYSKIGFEYNSKRSCLGNVAVQYLKLKQKIVKERNKAEKEARKIRKQRKLSAKRIYSLLKDKYPNINFRFVERSVYGKRKNSARISFSWLGFNEYLKKHTKGLGKTGQVWDKVVSKKIVAPCDVVYDFTVNNDNHNFIANNFVVSNCGVRTLKTNLTKEDVDGKKKELADVLFKVIPAGLGSTGDLRLGVTEIDEVLEKGAEYVIDKGYGSKTDLEFIEENGKIAGADPAAVSQKAKQRQFKQVGTLGSGNHYLEVQYVDEIFDAEAAKAFGLEQGQILISLHCGSRALGHQIGTDYLQELDRAVKKYGIKIAERELVCAPINSDEGQKYFSAVKAGINCAFANRQVLAHLARQGFKEVFGMDESEIPTFYEVGHNTAKIEKHNIDGKTKEVLVQRKGSTRGFGPGRKEVPEVYRDVGQPVLVGGTMGTSSYILAGTEKAMEETFGSTVHGAGRAMSRIKAKSKWSGNEIINDLARKGIIIRGHDMRGVAEEAPLAYKDVSEVIEVMHAAGISKKIVRVKPLISIKG